MVEVDRVAAVRPEVETRIVDFGETVEEPREELSEVFCGELGGVSKS
jgi:hypothetical protein